MHCASTNLSDRKSLGSMCLCQVKEAKSKSFKNVYAKDVDADVEHLRTSHLNDDEETEIEKCDLVDGNLYYLLTANY